MNGVAPSTVTDPEYNSNWLYDGVGDLLAPFMSPEAVAQFKQDGFYSDRPKQGLKIISINNNYGARYALLNNNPKIEFEI